MSEGIDIPIRLPTDASGVAAAKTAVDALAGSLKGIGAAAAAGSAAAAGPFPGLGCLAQARGASVGPGARGGASTRPRGALAPLLLVHLMSRATQRAARRKRRGPCPCRLDGCAWSCNLMSKAHTCARTLQQDGSKHPWTGEELARLWMSASAEFCALSAADQTALLLGYGPDVMARITQPERINPS